MAGEINFLITVAFLAAMAYVCNKRCSTEGSYQSPITKVLMFLGMGLVIIGMAFYYTFGYYALEIYAPFLIVGMLIALIGGCKSRSDQNYIPPRSKKPTYAKPTEIIMTDPMTLDQLTESARTRGMLVERRNPEDPMDVVNSIRCPTCRYLFELRKARIIDNTVICPSCEHDIQL